MACFHVCHKQRRRPLRAPFTYHRRFTFTNVTTSLLQNAVDNSRNYYCESFCRRNRKSRGLGRQYSFSGAITPTYYATLSIIPTALLFSMNIAMAEATRLIGMLRASAAHNANTDKSHQLDTSPKPESRANLQRVLDLLRSSAARHLAPAPTRQPTATTSDLQNDLAIANCKRIFAARSDVTKLQAIALSVRTSPSTPKMAGRFPVLSTSNLPPASATEQSATASPARGSAMLNSIFKSVRVPEFRFRWMFWAEKGQQSAPKDKTATSEEYASRPKPLGEQIISIKEFYQHFNNIPVENLKLRDSIHLFHMGIKPVWEDPRNTRGGAWYFKVSKDVAPQFWHELCLLAVGDVLQGAVETKRACKSFMKRVEAMTDTSQHSTTTSAVCRTLSAGTQFRSLYGTEMQRTRLGGRSC